MQGDLTCQYGHDHLSGPCPYQKCHDEVDIWRQSFIREQGLRLAAEERVDAARAAVLSHMMMRGYAEVIANRYLDDWFGE